MRRVPVVHLSVEAHLIPALLLAQSTSILQVIALSPSLTIFLIDAEHTGIAVERTAGLVGT